MNIKDKKELARLLIETRSCSDEHIIEKLGLTNQQLSEWKEKEQWKIPQKTLLSERGGQLLSFYRQLTTLNASVENGLGFPTEKEAMVQRRLAASITHLETEVHIGTVIKVAMDFLLYIRKEDVEEAQRLTLVFDDYIKQNTPGKRSTL